MATFIDAPEMGKGFRRSYSINCTKLWEEFTKLFNCFHEKNGWALSLHITLAWSAIEQREKV